MTRPPTSPKSPEQPRLSKRMGELGLCSRREADRWITSGWVKVDGEVVDTLGARVSPKARIEIDRAGPSYTIDTIRALRREEPSVEWFYITGGDALGQILRGEWRDTERLLGVAAPHWRHALRETLGALANGAAQ